MPVRPLVRLLGACWQASWVWENKQLPRFSRVTWLKLQHTNMYLIKRTRFLWGHCFDFVNPKKYAGGAAAQSRRRLAHDAQRAMAAQGLLRLPAIIPGSTPLRRPQQQRREAVRLRQQQGGPSGGAGRLQLGQRAVVERAAVEEVARDEGAALRRAPRNVRGVEDLPAPTRSRAPVRRPRRAQHRAARSQAPDGALQSAPSRSGTWRVLGTRHRMFGRASPLGPARPRGRLDGPARCRRTARARAPAARRALR